jgi:predicted TIM-barrel fold metal-dependent hydrolase
MDGRDEAGQHQGDRVNSPAASRPFSPRIDRNYPKPKLKLPPGACDTHFHFIGPQKQFPLKPNHVFGHLEFEDTPIEDWLTMQAALGLSRGLHVQSMMYESNYEIALHAQSRLPDRIRSVIVPWTGIVALGWATISAKTGLSMARFPSKVRSCAEATVLTS